MSYSCYAGDDMDEPTYIPELESMIDAVLSGSHPNQSAPGHDGLLMMGPWVEAAPMAAFVDPRLDPYERTVFGALWATLKRNHQAGVMPSYDDMQQLCNIRSRARIAQSVTVLRLCRWITLYRRVRDDKGQHRGAIHILHPEPFPVADTLRIDTEYMTFAQTHTQSTHPRVQALACDLMASIRQTVNSGGDPYAPPTAAEMAQQRIRAIAPAHGDQAETTFFGTKLRRDDHGLSCVSPAAPGSRVHLMNSVVYKRTRCSSSNLNINNNKNTTTTQLTTPRACARATDTAIPSTTAVPQPELCWPEFISPNTRALLHITLEQVDPSDWQNLIDELAGQMRTRRHTHNPIRNPVVYFASMCQRIRDGHGGITDYALQESARRLKQAHMQAELARARHKPPDPSTSSVKTNTPNRDRAAELKKALRGDSS